MFVLAGITRYGKDENERPAVARASGKLNPMKPRANESAGVRRMTDCKYFIDSLNGTEGGKTNRL